MEHYQAIAARLERNRQRLAAEPNSAVRALQVKQDEKELANEEQFLRSRGLWIDVDLDALYEELK